jgi:hypothetical protein
MTVSERIDQLPLGRRSEAAVAGSNRAVPRWLLTALAAAVLAAVGLVVLRDEFANGFGPIDDHEPLRWMGADGKLSIWDAFPTYFSDTEVGSIGTTTRFRPSYYALRVAQSVVFGSRPGWWYASVYAMYVATGIALGLAVATVISTVVRRVGARDLEPWLFALVTGLSGLSALGLPAWRGIVTRLGPSEQLAMLAVAIAVLAASKAIESLSPRIAMRWWVMACASAGVAAMAKETFVPVALVVAACSIVFRAREPDGRKWLVSSLALAPSFLVAGAVGIAIISSGSDVYGRSASGGRLGAVWRTFTGLVCHPWWWSLAALVVAAAIAHVAGVDRAWRWAAGVAGVGAILVAIDAALNRGEYFIPRYVPRYRAVIDLVAWSQIWAAVIILTASLVTSRVDGARSKLTMFTSSCLVGIVAAASAWAVSGLRGTNTTANVYASSVAYYEQSMETVIELLHQRPDAAFILTIYHPSDHESATAVIGEVVRRTGRDVYLRVSPEAVGVGSMADIERLAAAGDQDIGLLPNRVGSPHAQTVCAWLNDVPPAEASCNGPRVSVVAVGM